MKLLIVEDEKALADALRDQFAREGYKVELVREGSAALQAIKKDVPDIVLLDILLPGKNGHEILAEIKADPELKNIPVIMLTNLDSDEDVKKSLILGAADYFVKADHPIKEIVEKVKEYSAASR